MAQPPIVKSLDAERDLEGLFDYIANDSGGRVHREPDGSPGIFAIWPWLIIYELQADGDGIFVWRILDGRRDVRAIVQSPTGDN